MKVLAIETVARRDRIYLVKVVSVFERSFVVFQLVTKGHPECLYDEIVFPIKDETEVEEVMELFSTTTEVIKFNVLSRKIDDIPYLDEVLEVPVKERTNKFRLILALVTLGWRE